ncbi:MAG: hypothetical protein JXR84_26865 [Anaerolineae bacterium]|nr:hypothetical protein [Anaerolineae bacterium]
MSERLPQIPFVEDQGRITPLYWSVLTKDIKSYDIETYLDTNDYIPYEGLLGSDGSPNVAESYDLSEDREIATVYLRRGLKWSDGEPFTADDIVFAIEVMVDRRLPFYLYCLSDPEALDDYTVRFHVSRVCNLRASLADGAGVMLTRLPMHYLRQFLDDREVFEQKADIRSESDRLWNNPDLPVLEKWVIVAPIDRAESEFVVERNPYYWKVDQFCNQLPYEDQVVFNW